MPQITDYNPAVSVATAPFAWPGGYPRYAVTDDGGCLCHRCCQSEAATIASAHPGDGWYVIGDDINWEDQLYCDHCGDRIESAYAEG